MLFSVIAFWKRIFGRHRRCDAVLQAHGTTSFLLPLPVHSLQPPVCMTTCRALHKLFWFPGEISTRTFLSGQQAERRARGLSIASTFMCKWGVRNLLSARNLHMTSNACRALGQPGSSPPIRRSDSSVQQPPLRLEDRAFSFGQGVVTRALPLPSHCLPCLAPFPA